MTSRNALIYLGLLAGALITLAPFGLSLLTSFTSAHQFATGTPLSLPNPPTLANYAALGDAGFGRALAVTALMTAMITLAQLTFSVLAAYAFARLEFTGRDALFWVYVATLMVPAHRHGGAAVSDDGRTRVCGTRSGRWCCRSCSARRTRSSCCASTFAASPPTWSTPPAWTGPTPWT